MSGPLRDGARRLVAAVRRRTLGRSAEQPRKRVLIDPDRAVDAAAYARRTRSRWQVVRPAETPARQPPRRFGSREGAFKGGSLSVPDIGVLWLERAAVVNSFGLVVTREGELVLDTSTFRPDPHRIPADRRQGKVMRIEGTAVSIATDHARRNYGHFLLDSLPRVALLERAGVVLADADHVICSSPGPGADRLLESLGVDPARRISPRYGIAIEADRTIVTSLPGVSTAYLPWIVEFLRERLAVPAGPPVRRLWIPRTGHRIIQNEAQLLPILAEHGFETYAPGSTDEDPRRVFAEAAVVAGGHGAGLSDIAFCRPGTAVLELLSNSHTPAYFWTLADSAGLRYGYLVGEAEATPEGNPAKYDYRIDPVEFRAALEATLGG